MELIKINPDHYVIVDDSKIKIDDFYIDDSNTVRCAITEVESYWTHRKHYKKVTHSTKPLEDVTVLVRPDGSDVSETIFDKVKEISLSKVKKLIGEVDMEEWEKTAVEWLIDWMKANQYFIGNDLLEAVHTAKAMEYFQNKKMYERGAEDFVKKVNQLSKPSSNE